MLSRVWLLQRQRDAALALDLEPNEGAPSNSMTLEQAEAFVQTVASATGRLPLIYVHPTWANGGETHFVLVIRVVS